MRIAARRGYAGTTVNQVVEATGLPASSIYWHFGSKEELLAEVLEYSFRQWQAVTPGFDPSVPGPWHERMHDSFLRIRARLDARPEYWRMGLMLAFERNLGSLPARDRFLAIRNESIAQITEWWRRMIGEEALAGRPEVPLALARLGLAGVDGLFLAQQGDDRWDVDTLLWMLAHGLEAAARRMLAEPDALPFRSGEPVRRAGGSGGGRASARRTRSADGDGPADASTGGKTDGEARLSGRERILLAAAEVAAEHGYQGTTISRVCKRAGLPGSSLYWFFKDKDAMLAAVVAHSYEEWRSRQFAPGPVPPGSSWAEVLRAASRDNWSAVADSPNFLRIGCLLLLERRETTPAGRDMFQRIRRHTLGLYTDWFGEWLPAGLVAERPGLPVNLARLMMAFSDGMLISLQVDRPEWEPRRFADIVITMLEAGTRCPPPPAGAASPRVASPDGQAR